MHSHGLMLRDRGEFTAYNRTLLSDVGVHSTHTFKMFQNLKFYVMNLKFYLQNLKSYLQNSKFYLQNLKFYLLNLKFYLLKI